MTMVEAHGQEMSHRQAHLRAIERELAANDRILLVGGTGYRGSLPERFADRELAPPWSEFATCGAATGLAIGGYRPFVALHTSSFMFYGWGAIVNEAPMVRYLSGGRASAPVVFHIMAGSRGGGGPQHEHTPQAMLHSVPGLRVLAPSSPREVDAVLHAALTGGDPSVIVDSPRLGEMRGDVPDSPDELVAVASVRDGSDGAIVSYSFMVRQAIAAAELLEREGLHVAVLSVPVLAPFPGDALVEATRSFSSVMFVDEARAPGSPCGSWLAHLAMHAPPGLRLDLMCSLSAPVGYAGELSRAVIPQPAAIAERTRALITGEPSATQ